MTSDKVLFITDSSFINYKIAGGVQLCTSEFIRYFTDSGYKIVPFTIEPDKSIITRVKVKSGIDAYERYKFDNYLQRIASIVKDNDIKLIALNQVNLCPIIPGLRPLLPADIKFIALSHGNESGDYLHSVSQTRLRFLRTWKLGRLIKKESIFYSNFLNGVIIISEHEAGINQWLGATKILFLPRILEDKGIEWNPVPGRIGFVGRLDHGPNYDGILQVANALKKKQFNGAMRIVGAPSNVGRDLAKKFSFIEYAGELEDKALIIEAGSWCLFLNPVFRYARGSSTKLAQAINWGVPILTTPAGRRGYILTHEKIVVPDHDPGNFAEEVIRALNNKEELLNLRNAVKENSSEFNQAPQIAQLQNFISTL